MSRFRRPSRPMANAADIQRGLNIHLAYGGSWRNSVYPKVNLKGFSILQWWAWVKLLVMAGASYGVMSDTLK